MYIVGAMSSFSESSQMMVMATHGPADQQIRTLDRQRPSVANHKESSTTNKDARVIVSPEQYINRVELHAQRDQAKYLHSGVNYLALARFLQSAKDYAPCEKPVMEHACLVVHIISATEKRGIDLFTSDQVQKHDAIPAQDQNVSKLFFIRGHASRQWLASLGARYRLDPEFFRRHREFVPSLDHYDLPTLPSASLHIITLRIMTIYKRKLALSAFAVRKSREDAEQIVRKHQQNLGIRGIDGESIIRRLSFPDETHFTVEQAITCCGKKRSGGWQAFIWLDSGRNLVDQFFLNGRFNPSLGLDADVHCVPVIQHQRKIALTEQDSPRLDQESLHTTRLPKSFQSSSVLPFQYGSFLDPQVMAADLMYSLTDLFSFAAHSECQFLNMLEIHIAKTTKCTKDEMELALDDLKYIKSLLEDRIEYLSEILICVRKRGDPRWPRATQQAHVAVVDDALKALEGDFDHLLQRSKNLSTRCTEGASMITNGAMLEESKKAMHQAKRLNRLSLLAFFFLPLSFATSVFGMNFKQFGQGDLSVWIFPLVLIPIFTVSILLTFWDKVVRCVQRHQKGAGLTTGFFN
ncbi:MAG: hypothetical protein Q9191_006110 [Dirinaria sp. TL-2023a]